MTTTTSAPLPVPPTNIDEMVAQYVSLRDKLKEADDAHKKRTQAAKDYKELLEGKLMEQLINIGGDSVKTKHGTVYRSTKRTASISDGAAFRAYVIGTASFDLLDWKANALAVDDHIKVENAPPPGVNFTLHHTLNVRRA